MSKSLNNVSNFFNGTNINKLVNDEHSMKTVETIFNYNSYQLEADHAFIQWVFPTFRPSQFNPTAPVITLDEIRILRKDPKIIEWLNKFKVKMFIYWGLMKSDDLEVGFSGDIRLLNGHNGLRLSRAIECLTLFGIEISCEIFDILETNILNGTLKPFCEFYEDQMRPLWFIRYIESSKIVSDWN